MDGRVMQPDWTHRVRLKMRHLRLFVALDRHGSLQRAADELGISQPAASKLLSDTETVLETKLFTRHPRGLTANQYGEVLIHRAKMVLSELEQAGVELSALQSGHGGTVAVGTVSAPGIDVLVAAIADVRRDNPEMQITVQVDPSERLAPLLLEGSLDFAICRVPRALDPRLFDYREIGGAGLSFVCGLDHPLARRRRLRLAELADMNWVLQPPGSLLRDWAEALFRMHGLAAPRRCVNCTSFIMTLALLHRTDAVSMVPTEVAELLSSLGSVKILPLKERLVIEPVGLLSVRHREFSPAGRLLLAAVSRAAWPDAYPAKG